MRCLELEKKISKKSGEEREHPRLIRTLDLATSGRILLHHETSLISKVLPTTTGETNRRQTMNNKVGEKDQESRYDLKPQTMMLLQLRNVGSVTDVKENVMSLSSSSGECCVNVLQRIESEDWRVGLTGKSSPFPYRGRYTMYYRSIPQSKLILLAHPGFRAHYSWWMSLSTRRGKC